MPLVIRRAAAEDFVAVAGLLHELGRGPLRSDTEAIYRERYAKHIGRADTASIVAEVDGEVIGFLSLEFRDRIGRRTREAWIPDIVVTESRRGQGLGKALLKKAFALAREAGCSRITLETGYDRKIAHQLYRSAGMSEQGIYMDFYPYKADRT